MNTWNVFFEKFAVSLLLIVFFAVCIAQIYKNVVVFMGWREGSEAAKTAKNLFYYVAAVLMIGDMVLFSQFALNLMLSGFRITRFPV